MVMQLILWLIFFSSSQLALSVDKIKVQQLKSKEQTLKIELRSLEKVIRTQQEDLLNIQQSLDLYQKKQVILNQETPIIDDISAQDHNDLARLELSLIDEDSLESLSNQDTSLEILKNSLRQKKQMSLEQKVFLEKRKYLDQEVLKYQKLQQQQIEALSLSQRKKSYQLANIKDIQEQLKNYEDFQIVEAAIKEAKAPKANLLKQVGTSFSEPVVEYARYALEEKGLRIECYDQCQIIAPATGYVIHIGELLPYGKILILSHGKNMRSVYLGNLRIKIQKGHKVYRGDRIANTIADNLSSFYFELRKDNEAVDIFKSISFI